MNNENWKKLFDEKFTENGEGEKMARVMNSDGCHSPDEIKSFFREIFTAKETKMQEEGIKIQKKKKNNWQDKFPFDTFNGETKRQLVTAVQSIINDIADEIKKIVSEREDFTTEELKSYLTICGILGYEDDFYHNLTGRREAKTEMLKILKKYE